MSTLRFFVEWLLDQMRGTTRWVVGTLIIMALSYGANHSYRHFFPNPKITEESTQDEMTSNRAPASIEEEGKMSSHGKAKLRANHAHESSDSSSSGDDRLHAMESNPISPVSPSLPVQPSYPVGNLGRSYSPGLPSPAAGGGKSGGGGGASASNTGGSGTSGSSPLGPQGDESYNSSNGTANGTTYSATGGGVTIPNASSFSPVSSSEIVPGGGWSHGTNISAQVTVGGVTAPGVQTGTGIRFISGLEGTLYSGGSP